MPPEAPRQAPPVPVELERALAAARELPQQPLAREQVSVLVRAPVPVAVQVWALAKAAALEQVRAPAPAAELEADPAPAQAAREPAVARAPSATSLPLKMT